MSSALDLVSSGGYRSVTIESIAAKSGVAKTTIYRRWPNRAAVIMDAFLARVGPPAPVDPDESFIEGTRRELRALAKAFRGEDGAVVRALLAECQFDAELARAFLDRWMAPTRETALARLRAGVRQGAVRPDADLEAAVDLLYAPLYFQLQLGAGGPSNAYVDALFDQAMRGLRP